MPERILDCGTPEDAARVVREASRPGDPDHGVRQDGQRVIITYFDARFACDVADWAFQHGYASDVAAAAVIASL